MEIYSRIYKEKGLFLQKYTGEFSAEEYKNYALATISKPEWNYVTKSLFDFRDLTFSGTEDVIDELIKFRNEMKIQNIVTVYLVSSPLATVLTHLYIDQVKSSNYYYCTTIEKAISILEIDTNSIEIEALLLNLTK